MRSGVEIEQVLTQNIKKNKTLIQVIQNSISIRKTFPFPDLFRGVTRLFCGIFHSCFGIIVSRFGRFRSCFGVIHLFRRNFLSFQRIIHLFRGIFHSRCGIKLSCCGSFLCLSEIKPTLFELFSSNPNNRFGFKIIKTLIYG